MLSTFLLSRLVPAVTNRHSTRLVSRAGPHSSWRNGEPGAAGAGHRPALAAAMAVLAMPLASVDCSTERSGTEVGNGKQKFRSIIVGGGTAGCLSAYFHAKWMTDQGIPGNVLLIERGDDYSPARGPNPKMEGWYENWGAFGEAHAAVRENGSEYPVTGTDHRGLGGCSTHDTRITFQPTRTKKIELAASMGWTENQIDSYYQAALNMIPVQRAIMVPEKFYQDIIDSLTASSNGDLKPLHRLSDDHFHTEIVIDSIAENSVAMFQDEHRFTTALLLRDEIRPPNLIVLTNVTADRVLLAQDPTSQDVNAVGVVVKNADDSEDVLQLEKGGLVAITAGAIGTPCILQRSGIGPKQMLAALGIETIVHNDEVGHGVDHIEAGLMYLPGKNTKISRGGAMGWPLSLFLSIEPDDSENSQGKYARNSFVQCHFGAGSAEPYTDTDAIVCTPSCTEPDHAAGFRVKILSKEPKNSSVLVHAEQFRDIEALYKGIVKASLYCEKLQMDGLAGERIRPPLTLDLNDKSMMLDWIRENHYTVFHWACTCTAGINGRVADSKFRVLRKIPGGYEKSNPAVINNLFVGSGAALPDLPEANPHLTISAFAIALADVMYAETCRQHGSEPVEPIELRWAREMLHRNGALTGIRPGLEYPSLSIIASSHGTDWKNYHIADGTQQD